MPVRKWEHRIKDILDAIDKILQFTDDMDFSEFSSDVKTFDAVIRNFTVIGDAANYVPDDITTSFPEIPWQDMRDMRNVLVHEYFGVNKKIVWETVQNDLQSLSQLLKPILLK